MTRCLLTEPIHPEGVARLEAAGLVVERLAAPDRALLAEALPRAEAVITRIFGLTAGEIALAGGLRVIGKHGVGFDMIDVAAAARRGIPVIFTPGANARSVAEAALAFLFALARELLPADRALRDGDAAYKGRARPRELAGLTLAVLGYGATGRTLAGLAAGLGLTVKVWARPGRAAAIAADGHAPAGDLEALLAEADAVSLHLPLTDETRGLISAERLARMKPDAFLINTSRGGLVDEAALAAALTAGRLGGAGLDDLTPAMAAPGSPLLRAPNCLVSPHTAASTDGALRAMSLACVEQVLAVLAGRRPSHLVVPAVWPEGAEGPRPVG
ncbi:D-3-phosphoglycerate dehydrogenase [Tistlia consotensis]|uniref:D-3-phosphoglycerate dehydrogenase n=1 Tax=Tistlia consotensis USBA 355 TaxID=560819 RepID=A0A1Y6CHL2_9PROT|nr:NAD(P)-dependent oxidoreductase [Tistlia consotensis]SMF55094.1 D-3-phosphoglycerate dehydrogenase [Tistlia consotensis USBA 355]SNR87660.1 D-3-phosphoglycerate dehydrogenase [Tistlia consotensis]